MNNTAKRIEGNRHRESAREAWRGWCQSQRCSSHIFLVTGIMLPKVRTTQTVIFCHTNFIFSLNNIYSTFCFCLVLPFVDCLWLMHFNLTCWESQHNEGSNDYTAGYGWAIHIPIFKVLATQATFLQPSGCCTLLNFTFSFCCVFYGLNCIDHVIYGTQTSM